MSFALGVVDYGLGARDCCMRMGQVVSLRSTCHVCRRVSSFGCLVEYTHGGGPIVHPSHSMTDHAVFRSLFLRWLIFSSISRFSILLLFVVWA